jgi:hypothetical protein
MTKQKWFSFLDYVLAIDIVVGIAFVVRYRSFLFMKLSATQSLLFYGAYALFFVVAMTILYRREWLYIRRVELIVSSFLFVILFLVAELLFTAVTHRMPVFSRHPYLNFITTPNYKSVDGQNSHNSLGFRGPEITIPKPAGIFRIAIIGGSTVYETEVARWQDDFARQLERELKSRFATTSIEVINAGVGGYSTFESLIDLELRVLDTQPDLIIIYHNVNDVIARIVAPNAYRGDNSGRRKQWSSESRCYYLLCSTILGRLTGITHEVMDTDAPAFGGLRGSQYNDILSMTPAEALEQNKPVYFERNIRNMIAVAKENNVAVMLATWAHTNVRGGDAATPHYEKAFIEQNDSIKQIGLSKGIPVYDFAKDMPMDIIYWTDQIHQSVLGVSLKSSLFADFMFKDESIKNLIIHNN